MYRRNFEKKKKKKKQGEMNVLPLYPFLWNKLDITGKLHRTTNCNDDWILAVSRDRGQSNPRKRVKKKKRKRKKGQCQSR